MSDKSGKVFFSIPCWVREYIRVFIDFSLRCHLFPNNTPKLVDDGFDVTYFIYTDSSGEEEIRNSSGFDQLSAISNVLFFDIFDFGNSKRPMALLSEAHSHTLAAANIDGAIAILFCSDAIFNDGGIFFSVDKIKIGFKLVVTGAVRVNKENCIRIINEDLLVKSSGGAGSLSAQDIIRLIVNEMHNSEKAISFPSCYYPHGWAGNPAWFLEGVGLIRRGLYFNPVAIDAQYVGGLSGYSFDNCNVFDDFLDNWEKDVFVVTDANDLVIVDLCPVNADPLPKTVGVFNPLRIAAHMILDGVSKWQERLLEYKCKYYISHEEHKMANLERLSDSQVFDIKKCMSLMLECPELVSSFRTEFLVGKYSWVPEFDVEALFLRIEEILKEVGEKPLVVYGAGDHTLFLLEHTPLINHEVIWLADSDFKKWGLCINGIKCVSPKYIPDISCNVLISSLNSEKEIYRNLIEKFGSEVKVFRLYG